MKTGYKVLAIVLGVVMVLSGSYCLMTPELTFLAVSWIVGICMIIDGVGNITTWKVRKELGFADGWTLFAATLSLCLGVVVIASEAMQIAMDIFIAYLAAVWVLWIGILRLARSVKMHHLHKELSTETIAKHWWLVMLSGILMIVIGIFSLINPGIMAIAIGMLIGIDILFAGINMLITACIA